MTAQNAITIYEPPAEDRGNPLYDPAAHGYFMQLAGTLAMSQFVPPHFRGKVPDVLFAMILARRMGEELPVVMSVVHFVNGRPGWYAPYLISRANASGIFADPLDFETTGSGPTLAVTCSATIKATGKSKSLTVPMTMAVAEGWAKQNPKYQSMPVQMLSYRSATFFIRLYAPGLLYGLPTADEVEDTVAAGGPGSQIEVMSVEDRAPAPAPAPTGVAATREALAEPPSSSPQSPAQTGDTDPPGGSGPAASAQPVVDLDQRQRNDLIAKISELGLGLPEVTRRSLREQHGLQKISPTKADIGKLSRLLAGIRSSLAALAHHEAWEDPGTPTGDALRTLLADVELDSPDDVLEAAAQAAGVPVGDAGPITDGAPEPWLRRYLHEIRQRVGGAT